MEYQNGPGGALGGPAEIQKVPVDLPSEMKRYDNRDANFGFFRTSRRIIIIIALRGAGGGRYGVAMMVIGQSLEL